MDCDCDFVKSLPQSGDFMQWRCPSVCLFVRLSPTSTDGSTGLSRQSFRPQWLGIFVLSPQRCFAIL